MKGRGKSSGKTVYPICHHVLFALPVSWSAEHHDDPKPKDRRYCAPDIATTRSSLNVFSVFFSSDIAITLDSMQIDTGFDSFSASQNLHLQLRVAEEFIQSSTPETVRRIRQLFSTLRSTRTSGH
jgi:hypothetical protein